MPRTNRTTLTDRAIRAAKVIPPRTTADLFDALVPGLVLRVSHTGRRVFYLTYRKPAARSYSWLLLRDPTLTTPEYPALTLDRARELARPLLEAAGRGRDLAADQDAAETARLADAARTFGKLGEVYIEDWAKPRKKSWRADAIDIRTQLVAWKDRPVSSIRRGDVRELLDGIVKRGAPIRANRVLSLISKMLNVALDREWIEANVAAKITPPAKEQQRHRWLSDDEIAALWRWCELQPPATMTDPVDSNNWRLNRAVLQVRLITAARGNEILGMRWRDLEWKHPDGPWWTIPTTKNGQPHRLPLTKPAIKILRDLERRATDLSPDAYVFAGIRGKAQRSGVLVDLPFKDFRPRDLRRTTTTHLARLGVSRFDVKRVLNHVDAEITAAYDWHSYGPEKRAALEKWATRLMTLIKPLRVVRSSTA